MAPRFVQINCRESEKADPRQSRGILKYRPDIVFFETPQDQIPSIHLLNTYPPLHKPLSSVMALQSKLRIVSKKDPWVASDIRTLDNIVKLWNRGHQVLLYNV